MAFAYLVHYLFLSALKYIIIHDSADWHINERIFRPTARNISLLRPRFSPRAVRVGFVVDLVSLRLVPLRLHFPHSVTIPPTPPTHSHLCLRRRVICRCSEEGGWVRQNTNIVESYLLVRR